MRERTIWISAGLLGLVVAVGLALLTSHVSQPAVGVPGAPVSAGEALAPPRTTTTHSATPARTTKAKTSTTRTSATQTPVQSTGDADGSDDAGSGSGSGDDSSGKGRGRGRSGGDDD